MNPSALRPLARKIYFDPDNLWVELADGRKLSVPLAFFPRLLNATPQQREAYEISGGGTGLHWDEIDEDISIKHLFMGIGDRTHSVASSAPEKTLDTTPGTDKGLGLTV
jgi:hypothetical protein